MSDHSENKEMRLMNTVKKIVEYPTLRPTKKTLLYIKFILILYNSIIFVNITKEKTNFL